jgi:hypothetical protein
VQNFDRLIEGSSGLLLTALSIITILSLFMACIGLAVDKTDDED